MQGMAMFGLHEVQLFWERSLDTRVLVGWRDNMIVLSFRGTASLKNAFADIQVRCCLLSGHFSCRPVRCAIPRAVEHSFWSSYQSTGKAKRMFCC